MARARLFVGVGRSVLPPVTDGVERNVVVEAHPGRYASLLRARRGRDDVVVLHGLVATSATTLRLRRPDWLTSERAVDGSARSTFPGAARADDERVAVPPLPGEQVARHLADHEVEAFVDATDRSAATLEALLAVPDPPWSTVTVRVPTWASWTSPASPDQLVARLRAAGHGLAGVGDPPWDPEVPGPHWSVTVAPRAAAVGVAGLRAAPTPAPDVALDVTRLDLPEQLEARLAEPPGRQTRLALLAAHDDLRAAGDRLLAQSVLAELEDVVDPDEPGVLLEAVRRRVFAGQPAVALRALLVALGVQDVDLLVRLERVAAGSTTHGHALFTQHLDDLPSDDGLVVEVGSTRERVPGQGSTEQLARAAHRLGRTFVTVDMDPVNVTQVARLLARRGLPGTPVAAKGEDWLAACERPIAAAYLDAFDFEHDAHGELRQSRYETFLDTRIEDDACARMHLDCAKELVRLVIPGGLVAIDDTWEEDGAWRAKGATAVPHLLDNGFVEIDRTGTAIALRRVRDAGPRGTP